MRHAEGVSVIIASELHHYESAARERAIKDCIAAITNVQEELFNDREYAEADGVILAINALHDLLGEE